jgi:hypothetical protein
MEQPESSRGCVRQKTSPALYAELAYSYTAEGESQSGTYTKGFWFQASAKAFASRFPLSSDIVVRYRPGLPSESFLREREQDPRSISTPIV